VKAERQRRVVLDTDIWLSAALSPNGVPAQVVRAVLLQEVAVSRPVAGLAVQMHAFHFFSAGLRRDSLTGSRRDKRPVAAVSA
jgi:hypothetical protein